MGELKRVLTLKELCDYLRIGSTRMYQLIKEPGFPAVRISPKKIVVPVDALEKWMAERMGNGGDGQ